MDSVCNHRLFSIPSKVEMAEEQEYLMKVDSHIKRTGGGCLSEMLNRTPNFFLPSEVPHNTLSPIKNFNFGSIPLKVPQKLHLWIF